MRLLGPELILATSDLTKFARCDYATFLDHGVKRGTLKPLAGGAPSAMTELIAGKGDEHEHAYVESLRRDGNEVVTIARTAWTLDGLRQAEAETLAAMKRGAGYIYQAAFFDGRWSGYADLLERVDSPSPMLGRWSYEVVDTKLARAVRAHFILQLADYSHHLARLQGRVPSSMHVILGKGDRASFRVDDFDAYYRHVRASFEREIIRSDAPMPYPVEFCQLCDWSAHCWRQWNDADHLSLVANIRRTQVTRLADAGIPTLTALGEASPRMTIGRMADETFGALQHQARLQLQHRRSGQHTYELLPREAGRGFFRLPQAAPGDVFVDIEGDPFAGDLTYLFGAAWEEGGEPNYRAWWAHDAAAERTAFEAIIDFITARLHDHPESHVYHYGAIEVATFRRLMGQYGTREDAIDDLLRREVFVDLSAVVRQGMRISHSSYGLKKVETFYFERQSEGVADAGGAVLAYEKWIETNDPAVLAEIERYNREDCLSIVAMRRWLIAIRPDDVEWKLPQVPDLPDDDRLAREQQTDELYQGLLEAQPLLAHLLYYHRREERPAWWAYFERQKMTPQQLLVDSECIAGLTLDGRVAPIADKQAKIFTFRFPPQEHKFEAGQPAFDARNGRKAGEISSINDAAGVLKLRRTAKLLNEPPPAAIMPKPTIDSEPVRAAVRRFAKAALDRGLADTPYAAGADVLLQRQPRIAGLAAGQPILDRRADVAAIANIVTRLDRSYLFIQGPPGSGKTHYGARVIIRLLRAGKRVGITSNSHAAIHNLLAEIEEVAFAERFWFRGLKKASDERARFVSTLPNPMIESTDSTAACADPAVKLVAGTAWLFSDERFDQSFDYLFIDEAGQVSLANALAVSTAARNLVLLGDPLQLAQVSQGSHPEGAGKSVLEHLLMEQQTIPPDRGIFLEESWRMHPDVCAFVSAVVYESRLRSADECANQTVTIDGVAHTGLRFLPIEHEGNSQSSDEEARRIAAEIARMIGGTFTTSKNVTRGLRPDDFLVVAAYNAQVRRLTTALHEADLRGVPVGTVDRFQGKQAPIVFFSMATSTGAELPHGVEFLFSRNRLNVAISRARCLAVVVASPRLLDVDCKTPEQMRLVNGLCRFVEMAGTI